MTIRAITTIAVIQANPNFGDDIDVAVDVPETAVDLPAVALVVLVA